MVPHDSVIYHTQQAETSHSRFKMMRGKNLTMNESEEFRRRLIAELAKGDINEAQLSLKAGLNRRAVTDIREGRVRSPKLSTVFALARALNLDPGEMMGLGPRPKLHQRLVEYLSQYDEESQALFLAALRAFPPAPAGGQ